MRAKQNPWVPRGEVVLAKLNPAGPPAVRAPDDARALGALLERQEDRLLVALAGLVEDRNKISHWMWFASPTEAPGATSYGLAAKRRG